MSELRSPAVPVAMNRLVRVACTVAVCAKYILDGAFEIICLQRAFGDDRNDQNRRKIPW